MNLNKHNRVIYTCTLSINGINSYLLGWEENDSLDCLKKNFIPPLTKFSQTAWITGT